MNLAKTYAIGLFGLLGQLIEVEADISAQLPSFVLVGLPDASLSEATSRVRAACSNSGHAFPPKKVVVNLSPASVPKSGSGFDLAIAVAVLTASGVINQEALDGACFIGELGLDGQVRAVPGLLPITLRARDLGFKKLYCPAGNAAEAALVEGIKVVGVPNLRDLLRHFQGAAALATVSVSANTEPSDSFGVDLGQVKGQSQAVEALIVAAAGGHHISMIGAPGSGKTMLAERLPTILPRLTFEQALQVSAIESVASDGQSGLALNQIPRFIAPHHTSSMASIIGGGTGNPKPGAVSMAHQGILFLDEALEFSAQTLDGLREPLEAGKVVISRSAGSATFPARFQLALAANPCPCGRAGSLTHDCRCNDMVRRRYLGRLSGPILDRIDIRIKVKPVKLSSQLGLNDPAVTSAEAAVKVQAAREAATARLSSHGYHLNSEVPGHFLRANFKLGLGVQRELDSLLAKGKTSMRGYDRCLRLAWTIADLAGATVPTNDHLHQALVLRGTDDLSE